jgi:transposase InsO family protein
VKYSFIIQHKNTYPVSLQCRVLDVSRNGYYHYEETIKKKALDSEHQEMLEWVKLLGEKTDYSYGSRRMKKALNALSYPVSRNKARKLMQEAGIKVRRHRKYKATTNSKHSLPVFENVLARQFDVAQINQVYVSDITYIWTKEGWLYLAVVIDLCSRKVVGWSMDSRMKAKLVCDALQMALWQRRPAAGLIHHSDRGSQYASRKFRRLLADNKITGSMSRKGNCWDNAVAESFFGSLKKERVRLTEYQTRQEARQDILDYISMFYNSYRLHSTLGYICPNDYEKQLRERKKIA